MKKTKAYSYIRFSSPEQIKGDSLRRQFEATRDYANENNLLIDTSLNLNDFGLSAFHGIHKTKGALGQFLHLVNNGKIEKGSFLIVENLDRLSREQVLDALNQFTSIIKAGITIVTLQDKMVYNEKSINQNWAQLIISITYMARAHDESKLKSVRLKAAWNEKRKQARNGGKKLSIQCPLWLKLSEDKSRFIPISKVVEAIELIYNLKLRGYGKTKIMNHLNHDDSIWKPPKSKRNKSGYWRESYIQKILYSRAVIGEYQPYTTINSKRIPDGTPIIDYYPTIINKDLFFNVQSLIKQNREINGFAGGKTGKASNLFTHIAICGKCKQPMHYINKGKSPKGGEYLHCSISRRKLGCKAKPINYFEFEKIFFDNFEELNISNLLPSSTENQSRLKEIETRIISNNRQLAELDSGIENLVNAIFNTKDKRVQKSLDSRLSKVHSEKEILIKNINDLQQSKREFVMEKEQMQYSLNNAKEVYRILGSKILNKEIIELRLKLRQEIKKIVKRIEIYPLEEKFVKIEEIEKDESYLIMYSKYIDKVRILFNGNNDMRVIFLKARAGRF